MSKKNAVKPPIPTARDLLSALGEQVTELRPSVNPKPRNRQISAARATASVVNSAMSVVRTSIQAAKLTGKPSKLAFLSLDSDVEAKGS